MEEENKVIIKGIEVTEEHLTAPVLYIPRHANNDSHHPDCEVGFISTVRDGGIWVRFNEGDAGAKCDPENLKWL
jgi:hypothetical protein